MVPQDIKSCSPIKGFFFVVNSLVGSPIELFTENKEKVVGSRYIDICYVTFD